MGCLIVKEARERQREREKSRKHHVKIGPRSRFYLGKKGEFVNRKLKMVRTLYTLVQFKKKLQFQILIHFLKKNLK